MSNSERKGNLTKTTTTGKPQRQPTGQSEQQLVPSTSSERVPRSSAAVQCKLFAYSLINTNDQCSKKIAGQSPPSVFSTSNKCTSAETQSNASGGKSYAATLRSTPDHHLNQNQGQLQPPTSRQRSITEIQSNAGAGKSYASLSNNPDQLSTQTPGQSPPSVLSAQSNSPTPGSSIQDQTNANIQKLASTEFVDCGTGSTAAAAAAAKNSSQGKRNKLSGEYQHGSFLNKSSGNQDNPLYVTGTSSKISTELQSTIDHGDSHSPGIDTEVSKRGKPFRTCIEIEIGLQRAKHSSDMQEQHGQEQITDSKGLETKQSEYATSSNLASAKSSEEGKQNNVNLEQEPNEFQVTYAKITEKTTLSTAWNQGRPMPVAQQDFGTRTPNNNGEKTDETRISVDAKNEDKTKIAHSSVPTKRKSSICNLYFDKTTDPRKTLGCPDGIKSSDVSQNKLHHDVDSVLDDGKDSPMKLSDPCKSDTDFDFNLIGIPSCFYRKAEKSKNPETYIKKVSITVQGVIAKLYNSTKQAEELLKNAQNLQCASDNLQQLLDDHKNLKEKILPDIENEIKKWNHPLCNEELEKFISYLQSIGVCLQTWSKKIEDDLKLKNAEATQLRSKSISIIEPLQELYGLKAQTEELKQQLLVTPKLQCTKRNFKWITEDLEIASQNIEENINLLENLEKKYAEAKFVLNVDLEKVKACEIESLLSQLGTAKKALTSTTWSYLRYKEETRKKYQDILGVLQSTEINLQRRHKQFVATQEFENLVALTANLKNQATNCKESGLENAALLKTIESTLPKFCMFNVYHAYLIPEKDRESIKKNIREHEDELKKVQKKLAANENLRVLQNKFELLMEVSNNFNGTSCELKILISDLESLLQQYQKISPCGPQALIQTKVNTSISSLKTWVANLKHSQPGIEANEKFDKSCKVLSDLMKEVDYFWGPSSEIKKWIHKLSEQLDFYLKFPHMGNEILESKIKRICKEILLAQDNLRDRQHMIEAEEKFEKSYLQTSPLLEEIDNFWGPSYEIESLFQKINEVFKYYSDFQFMGNESLKNKLVDVKKRINTAHNNLMSRQPIIEAQERLVTIQEQAEKLQEKVSDFKGDMSSLRNYMKEVEKLQSDLSAFNTMDNDKLKNEAESVSQTIRWTLLTLEGIELQFENEMAELMAVEEYTEKQSPDLTHHLEESSNMKRICNIAMQLMSIYRQLSDSGINVMDSNQLRWLNMRIGDLEDMLVNGIEPKTAQEEKAFDNAKKLCFQIQQMIANNKQCEEISPELNDIRATGMKALEYHTKIFKGDISNNQIRWLETQLIECQTKLDRLELPEGVARESRKDVLNLCNQALSALKKHSWCKD